MTFIAGTVYLKRFADTSSMPSLAIAFVLLAIGNIMFVQVLRGGLGSGVVASSMSQIIVMTAISAFIFGERVQLQQLLGVAMAVGSIFLMSLPNAKTVVAAG